MEIVCGQQLSGNRTNSEQQPLSASSSSSKACMRSMGALWPLHHQLNCNLRLVSIRTSGSGSQLAVPMKQAMFVQTEGVYREGCPLG